MDRESYNRSSAIILIDIKEQSVTNYEELSALKSYKYFWSKHAQVSTEIRMLEDVYKERPSAFLKEDMRKRIIAKMHFHKELANIESSQPIQNILQRERKNGEIITMDFAKI